jgi:hypothetical protein
MEGVERIDQITPTRTHWVTKNGTHQAGRHFPPPRRQGTRVTLQLDHDPQDIAEKAADALGIVQNRVRKDMENVKAAFIQSRGLEEGGWRGDIGRSPQSGETALSAWGRGRRSRARWTTPATTLPRS